MKLFSILFTHQFRFNFKKSADFYCNFYKRSQFQRQSYSSMIIKQILTSLKSLCIQFPINLLVLYIGYDELFLEYLLKSSILFYLGVFLRMNPQWYMRYFKIHNFLVYFKFFDNNGYCIWSKNDILILKFEIFNKFKKH